MKNCQIAYLIILLMGTTHFAYSQVTTTEENGSEDVYFPDLPLETATIDLIWTHTKGVEVNGNKLTKTSIYGWNGGAVSKNKLAPNEDGWVEITIEKTKIHRYFGLSAYDKNLAGSSIDYSIYLHGNTYAYIYENGNHRGYVKYEMGDKIRIERQNDKIHYKRNGEAFHISDKLSTTELIADVSMLELGASIDLAVSFSVPTIPTRSGYDVQWTDMSGVSNSHNNLIKTNATGWNSGAASKNKLAANEDGWVESTIESNEKYYAFGLSSFNKDVHHNSIHYSIYFHINGTYYVYENGASKGVFGYHYEGDLFSVERENGNIHYKQNGRTFYVSELTTNEALIVDAAIYEQSASILNTRTSFDVPQPPTPREGHDVVWTNAVSVEVDGSSLTKLGAAGWNGGAASKNALEESEDGWVELTVSETDKDRMIGLAEYNANESYTTINYILYLHSNGQLYIYEKGANRGSMGFYYPEDIVSIEREEGKIHYKRNGETLYLSSITSTSSLLVDASLNQTAGTLTNVRTSFPVKEVGNREGYEIYGHGNLRQWLLGER
ncbi:MAG: hypothetical protein AAF960_16845 [Bacteroidota bacterium]